MFCDHSQGAIFPFQRGAVGDCLFQSIARNLGLEPEEFSADEVRLTVCAIYLKYAHVLASDTAFVSGLSGLFDKPLTVRDYFKMILKPEEWGDQMCLVALAVAWKVRITVVDANALTEYKLRHAAPLSQADIVVVYNGATHYIAASEYDHNCLFLNIYVHRTAYDK